MRPPCALSPSRVVTLASVLTCLALCACNLENLGDPPPDADLYLPTGLLLSDQSQGAPRFLYVINSNFDLRYNRGSLQAYDLDALNAAADGCAKQGPECVIGPSPLLVDEVLIPSLTTSFSISPDRKRLYLASRTEQSLTFVDLDEAGDGEAVLSCGDEGNERRCSGDRQTGHHAEDSVRQQVLPAEPVDMLTLRASDAAADLDPEVVPGQLVVVAHRGGQLSVFHDAGGEARPRLLHVLSNLPLEPTGIAFEPSSHLLYMSVYARNSLVSQARLLARAGINIEGAGSDTALSPSFAYDAGAIVVDGVAAQRDTRAIATNPAKPGQLLVVSRDPAALLFVDTQRAPSDPSGTALTNFPARDIVPVGAGPTRMALGRLGERDVAAVSCFDGHQLYLIDAATAEVLGVIHNLNGPFQLVIDSPRRRLYLADFRSSSVQVIDLSPLVADVSAERTDPRILATLGFPKVVMELQ